MLVGLVLLLAGAYGVMTLMSAVTMVKAGLFTMVVPLAFFGLPALFACAGLVLALRHKAES